MSLASMKMDASVGTLRNRALDLHKRLVDLRDALLMLQSGSGPHSSSMWNVFLEKFDILSKLYFQITEELDRAASEVGFEHFALVPQASLSEGTSAPTATATAGGDVGGKDSKTEPQVAYTANFFGDIPELLRSKLEPELESMLKEYHKMYYREMKKFGVIESRESSQMAFNTLNNFNDIVLDSLETMKDLCEEMLPPDSMLAKKVLVEPLNVDILRAMDEGIGLQLKNE